MNNKAKKVLKKISITMIIISLLLIIIGSLYFSFSISNFILQSIVIIIGLMWCILSIVIVIGLMWSIYGTISLIKNFKQNTKSTNNNDTEPEVNVNNEDISKISVKKKNINRKAKEIFKIISLIIIVIGLVSVIIGSLLMTFSNSKKIGISSKNFSNLLYKFIDFSFNEFILFIRIFLGIALVIGLIWGIYGLALLIKKPILRTISIIVVISRFFISFCNI